MDKKPSILENQTVRLYTAIGAGVLMLSTVATGVQSWTNLQRDIAYLTEAVSELNARVVGRSPEGWHKTQMRSWCDRTELVNRDLGWKCPAITGEWP